MSRPIKKGLSYFPLDTDILSDRKTRRLFQNYGCEGFSTYMAILCEAYGTTGYYVRYTDDFCFDIGFTLNLKEERVREIIGFCVEIRLFNRDLFARQGILTSFGIQSRYREINKRSISRISPKWEIREETAPIPTVEISVPVTETPVFAPETSPKGKGKENEGKECRNLGRCPDEIYKIDKNKFASKGRNTPFDGRTVTGKVKMTIVGGHIVYEE